MLLPPAPEVPALLVDEGTTLSLIQHDGKGLAGSSLKVNVTA